MPRRPKSASGSLLAFFATAGRLKSEPRRGWVLKLGVRDPESVADHSYRTALIAMVYADARLLDTEKVMKMALIHDLPEAIVGDRTPGEVTRRRKRESESAAIRKILDDLPERQRSEYLGVWGEFSRGRSREARLVRQVDKLEMALQAVEYRRAGWGTATREFLETASETIVDEDLREVLRRVWGDG